MNNWAIWLILFIPVAVSILSLLFRPAKEEPRRGPRMRPPQQEGAGQQRPTRRSVSDIDQFLEEINRRRREAAERRRGSEPVAVPVPPPPPERPAPEPPRARPIPVPISKPRRTERPRQTAPRQRERIPQPERVVVAEAIIVPMQEPAPGAAEEIAATKAPTVSPQKPVSPALAQLLPFLQSPQSLRTAVLLREILEGPIARRSRGVNFFGQAR